ncbi:MAG: hypothetical protein LBV45_01405 [Xanthomonadaceae bacterium]|jgi:hypothetical protein|nr:hypothetical protein [Xanthomonadaceae bacterium]
MDAVTVALASTAIVASSTVIAAFITTRGHIKTSRESEAKERLRDDIDRLRSENDWLRKSLAYSLRQNGGYHQLEDIYFRLLHSDQQPRLKAQYRQRAEEQCGIYPKMDRKQSFSFAEQIESGQSFISINLSASPEQESNK